MAGVSIEPTVIASRSVAASILLTVTSLPTLMRAAGRSYIETEPVGEFDALVEEVGSGAMRGAR